MVVPILPEFVSFKLVQIAAAFKDNRTKWDITTSPHKTHFGGDFLSTGKNLLAFLSIGGLRQNAMPFLTPVSEPLQFQKEVFCLGYFSLKHTWSGFEFFGVLVKKRKHYRTALI